MTTVETIPRATVWAALEGLGIPAGEPFNRTMVVHITGDHISYEQADGQTILWRRVVDECPSCHATPMQPHTEYCQQAVPAEIRELAERMIVDEIRNERDARAERAHLPWCGYVGGRHLSNCSDTHCDLGGDYRPVDDPADEVTCDGRNCGGKPHA